MAGRQASQTVTRYAGIQVQTSALGVQIPVGWGTHRSRCNLVDYLDFKSTPQKAAAAGKGGATTTGYNYSASIILAIEEGPIDHVTQVWVNGKQYAFGSNGSGVPNTQNTAALAQVGLTLGFGAIGQTPWSYLTSAHAEHAIGYSGLCIVYAENYPLELVGLDPEPQLRGGAANRFCCRRRLRRPRRRPVAGDHRLLHQHADGRSRAGRRACSTPSA